MNHLIPMSQKELRAVPVIRDCLAGRLTADKAADRLKVNIRTVFRLKAKMKKFGPKGLKHKSRGKAGHHKIPAKRRSVIKRLVLKNYSDFTPALASEKLKETHGIDHDRKTISAVMEEMGLLKKKNKRNIPAIHRNWREPKAHLGELIQFDGSYDDWFEGRWRGGPDNEICLLAAIDDATGTLGYAEFAPHEGLLPVLGFWQRYIAKNGLPQAIYLDKFSTYKMHIGTAAENPDTLPQFGRAMRDLDVTLHFANSPQAKGRVERLFRTLQDRLIKELRLHGIDDPGTANAFLSEQFIPDFNRRFGRTAKESQDFHRSMPSSLMKQLRETLSRHDARILRNDFTIVHGKNWYQLLPTPGLALRPGDPVQVRSYPDGGMKLIVRDKPANFRLTAKKTETRKIFPVKNGIKRIPTLA